MSAWVVVLKVRMVYWVLRYLCNMYDHQLLLKYFYNLFKYNATKTIQLYLKETFEIFNFTLTYLKTNFFGLVHSAPRPLNSDTEMGSQRNQLKHFSYQECYKTRQNVSICFEGTIMSDWVSGVWVLHKISNHKIAQEQFMCFNMFLCQHKTNVYFFLRLTYFQIKSGWMLYSSDIYMSVMVTWLIWP